MRFGRDYTPIFLIETTADPFGSGFVGQTNNIYVGLNPRDDNAIWYDSPRFAGVQITAGWQLGESSTDTNPVNSQNPTTCTAPATATPTVACSQAKHGNDRYEAGITYAAGPIFAGAGYEQIRSNLDTYRRRMVDAAATYDFGFLKLHASWFRTRDNNPVTLAALTLNNPGANAGQISVNARAVNLGVTVPFGAWTFLAQYGDLRDNSRYNNGLNYGTPRVHYPSAGFRYSLSKRTILYAAYSRENIKTGAQGQAFPGYAGIGDASNNGLYTAGNVTNATGQVNVNPYSYQFGIRHSF